MCRLEVFNMSSTLSQALKKMMVANDKSLKQTMIEPAEVVSINPFKIKLKDNNKLVLDRNMMSVCTQVNDLINDGRLQSGNKVLVIVSKGGDDAYVIDRI